MDILIVDDSESITLLFNTFLKDEGFEDIHIAKTASQAFQLLGMEDEGAAKQPIDLILMDIQLPNINGIEACRQIKSNTSTQDIPIIVVTATSKVKKLEQAFNAGAIDYIVKPAEKIELLTRVKSALKLKQEMDQRKAREKELLELTVQLQEANQKLHRLSFIDSLTQIANRRYFDHLLAEEWRRSLRIKKPISLIMIDIDYFKKFNDTYGHQRGDYCLSMVAAAFKKSLKRAGDCVARYGGEEFAVILPNTDLDGAVNVADKIEHNSSTVSDQVTVSMGISCATPPFKSGLERLISSADEAMYKAKQEGRDQYKLFNLENK